MNSIAKINEVGTAHISCIWKSVFKNKNTHTANHHEMSFLLFVVVLTIETLLCGTVFSASGLVILMALLFACPVSLKPEKSISNGY